MDDLVLPFAGVFRDNNLREDIALDRSPSSRPRATSPSAAR